MNDYEQRFTNVARLYQSERNPTKDILQRLLNTHVCIIGLGGVGSWVTESLARNGIGRLTLIDMDDVCISNINRQVMAQTSTIGKFKAESLKSRILDINPSAEVNIMMDFVRPSSAVSIITTASQGAPSGATSSHLQGQFDYVIDAVDSSADKAAIIDACVSSGTPVVTCGGVGGLTDPTLLTVSDLAHAEGDALLYHVRRTLRREYGYPSHKEKEEGEANQAFTQKTGRATGRVRKWGILAVHTRPTGISRSPVRTQRTSAESGSSDDEAEKVAVGSCSISRYDHM